MPGILVCTLLSLAAVSPSHAQNTTPSAETTNDARARELYDNGVILYDEGRYVEAIMAWEEAYRLSGKPLLLFNIANAQERLGSWKEALDTLNKYRVYARADEREVLNRRIINLEDRIRESPAPANPVPEPVASVASTAPAVTASPAPAPSHVRWVPWTLYGVGLAGAGVGTVFGLQAVSARDNLAKSCFDTGAGLLCPETSASDHDADSLYSLLADVSFGAGAAAVIGATVVLFVDRPASVSFRPSFNGLSLQGRF